MAAKKKEQKVRAQNYQARQQAHREKLNRIRRDNVYGIVAVIISIVILVATILITQGSSGTDADNSDNKPDTSDTSGSTDTADSNDSSEGTDSTDGTGTSTDLSLPDKSLAEDRDWSGELAIDDAHMSFTLFGKEAPQAVSSFVYLINEGYFDNTECHRTVPSSGQDSSMYILQCGDPTASGMGGPGYSFGPIENAPESGQYDKGWLAMARVGNDGNSMGSQFFIVYEDSLIGHDNAGGYTVFGEITEGLDQLIDRVLSQGTVSEQSSVPKADARITEISVK